MATYIKREYHNNGKIKCKYFLCDGKIEGKYKEYFENGQFKIICNYIDNKKHGECKYYDQGTYGIYTYCIYNYIDDKLNGIYKKYDKNRNILIKFNYINGKIQRIL